MFIGNRNLVNGIIRLLESDVLWPKVIPLSGAYCTHLPIASKTPRPGGEGGAPELLGDERTGSRVRLDQVLRNCFNVLMVFMFITIILTK